MAKVRNNVFLQGVSGMVGHQIVVRRRPDGTSILALRPQRFERDPSASQEAQREHFLDAIRYAKTAKTAPEYQALAESRGVSAFNVAVADFFNPPKIKDIDLSSYTGDAGQSIAIKAIDDVKVTSVTVRIEADNGAFIEKGAATPASDGSWLYTTTTSAPAGAKHIVVGATDMAGNRAEQTATQ